MRIKGFDKNLCCRGMQFEIGKTYDTGAKDDEIELCTNTVFHYCKTMQNVHRYYNCAGDNRFCEVEVLGAEITDGTKCGSNKIKIIREITGYELDILCGKTNGNTGLFNTGYWNTGHSNTGQSNTGDWNTGHSNTGNSNTGHSNTGDWNTGDWNTGIFNTCDFSCGVFCTESPKINIFNVKSEWTMREFMETKYYNAIVSAPLILTEWVKYTDDEKRDDSQKNAIGGHLKQYTFRDACKKWWEKLSPDARKTITEIPNFDPDIFFEITGIKTGDEQ